MPRVAPRHCCAICNSEGVVLHEMVQDHYFGIPGEWRLKRCANAHCGLVWQDPMVIPEDLGLAYQNYYTHGSSSTNAVALKPSVIDDRFHAIDRWMTRLLRMGPERWRFALSYLHDTEPGYLLDVGCGGGFFTDKLQRLGWTVRGSDFDAVAARTATEAYGFPVDVGNLSAIGYADASFDAVTVRHVIEHVPDPAELLAECWRILRPGGVLVFITPNSESLGHEYFGSRWRGLEQPRHLWLFNVKSMRMLFSNAGLTEVNVFSTAQGAPFVNSDTCRMSKNSWQSWTDYAALWWLYASERLLDRISRRHGEELISIAKKK